MVGLFSAACQRRPAWGSLFWPADVGEKLVTFALLPGTAAEADRNLAASCHSSLMLLNTTKPQSQRCVMQKYPEITAIIVVE